MKRHLFALLLLLGVHGAFAQGYTPRLDLNTIEHWWPFCSATDLLDRTMTGFDLLSSAVSATTDRYGYPNRAYDFNGINSELHYTAPLTIPLFGIADFTYACYIYPTVAQRSIIMYNGDPSLDGLGIIMTDPTGTVAGTEIGVMFGGLNVYVPTTGATVTLNQWHHVCLKRNGNSYILVIDGIMATPAYIPSGFPAAGYNTPTGFFQFGLNMTAGTMPFTGKIDDAVIYGRQLSNPEIVTLSNHDPNIIFSLGNDTAICPNQIYLGGGITISTTRYPNIITNPTNGYKYVWSNGDTVSTIDTTFLNSPQPPVTITLSMTRSDYSCPGFDAITIRHIIPVVNIGPDHTMCTGDSVVLNPTPTPGVVDYLWNTGATTPSLVAYTADDYWLRVDSNFTFTNTITGLVDTQHCIAVDTAHVMVTPAIFVTLNDFDTSCNGVPIVIRSADDTAYTSPTYIWQDGITTTPTFSATTSGVYWVQVTDGACVRSDTAHIVVVNVSATIFSNDTAICKGASVVASATGSPGVIYQWTPTAGIGTSNIPTPTITPDTSAWYHLTTTILDPASGALLNCASTDSFFIDVQPYPTVKMGGNRIVCQYDTIKISPIVTPYWYTHYIYDWSPGNYLDDSAAPTVIFTAGDTTKLVLWVSTPAGCKSADSAIIYTFLGDYMSMASDTAICPGDSVVIGPTSTEPGLTNYTWYPSTYINFPTSSSPVTIKPIGNMSYKVVGTSMYGCNDTLSYDIGVFPAAVITLEDSVTLFPGDSYKIQPITNCTYYSWFPPVGLDDTGISTPTATPPVSTRYILTARTQDNCATQDSISIRLNDNSIIAVPNAFAPGSFNSTLSVILKGVARLRYFRVYDRWGKVVFEGKNIVNGWDGTIDGKPQPAGVYVYEAEAITDKGKILHKQGNVTLLR